MDHRLIDTFVQTVVYTKHTELCSSFSRIYYSGVIMYWIVAVFKINNTLLTVMSIIKIKHMCSYHHFPYTGVTLSEVACRWTTRYTYEYEYNKLKEPIYIYVLTN